MYFSNIPVKTAASWSTDFTPQFQLLQWEKPDLSCELTSGTATLAENLGKGDSGFSSSPICLLLKPRWARRYFLTANQF